MFTSKRYFWILGPLVCLFLGAAVPAQQNQNLAGTAFLLDVRGVIGPATSDYIQRAMARGSAEGAALIILRMDTPGGLDTAMREIIQDILASPVPVVGYIAPSGARAASAGTYIMYASHIAAMAPTTNLGAATPVHLPMSGRLPEKTPPPGEGEEAGTLARKAINDAVAYIKGLAAQRGRNERWAEKAVREAASLSAQEALEMEVIDLIARDVPALLKRLDGRTVDVVGGEMTLQTTGMTVIPVEPNWRDRLLAIIANPNVAYILMLVGIYGLIFEMANPGFVLPGVVGTISLLLALYAFQVLPISSAGLALMLLGIAFMAAEIFVPSFGALGIGGVIAFVIGSVILLDTNVPGYDISWPLIVAAAVSSAGFLYMVLFLTARSQQRPVVSGREQMLGATGKVTAVSEDKITVRVHGELWSAQAREPVILGQRVRVIELEGLVLLVKPELEENLHD
ncbi:NfeD family protein [Nitrosococcus oceani]|uniref:NfeD family protein n=1 Tax=Nitrosococcus oceani TaxID=1229 RepID=UPI0004E8EB37|nr:nodulation protein NfeD [Nitrosococcus oceani]KFI22768.1 serine protease [Nitrosococcus oceani]